MDFLGPIIFDIFVPILEFIAEPVSGFKPIPGQYFPYYFTIEYFQRPLIASIVVAIVAGLLGTFLLIRNLALIGDGLAHVSFGGIAVGLVLGGAGPLWYALVMGSVGFHQPPLAVVWFGGGFYRFSPAAPRCGVVWWWFL